MRFATAGGATFTVALLACALFASSAAGQTFSTITLDDGSNGDVGSYNSMIAVNGNPAVCYWDTDEKDLRFARNSASDGSGTWSIVRVDRPGSVGTDTSMEIVNGNPAISYYDVTNGALKYVRAADVNGAAWGAPVTITTAGNTYPSRGTSLAVINGNPAISFYGETNDDLKYVRATDANGTAWGTPLTLDSTGVVGVDSDLAVVGGNPAIAYIDSTNKRPKYIRASNANGSSWGTPVFVDTASTYSNGTGATSLEVVNGNPAICYFRNDTSTPGVTFVRATNSTGSSWGSRVIIDSDSSSPGKLVIANNNPAVSYDSWTLEDGYQVKFARATNTSGSTWAAPVVIASNSGQPLDKSLAIIGGNPAVAFYSNGDDDLLFVRATNATGSSWAAVTTVDSGLDSGRTGYYASLAAVAGNPAISYSDQTNRKLNYVRSNDASGTSWAAPVILDTGEDFEYTSLTVVNGYPAICYMVSPYYASLKYARANDATGSTWGAPVTVVYNSGGYYAKTTSLTVINGQPAICYHHDLDGDLKYVRALDASGTSWGAPLTLDATGDVGEWVSLAEVNGNPAAAYHDVTNGDLKYVRATDANGATWDAAVGIATTGVVGKYVTLAVVNGNPAISYYDETNGDLKYVRATDATGSAWAAPVSVDTAGNVGQHASMAVINGRPAICYHDATNGRLKYVRASDANGATWGTPATVPSINNIGQYSSLQVINGNPGIAFHDYTEYDLAYATITAEIAVEQPAGTDLTDGAASIGFGTVTLGSSTAKVFTVRNTGSGELTGLDITFDGANAGDFSVTANPTAPVSTGGSTTFTVTFAPAGADARNATLHIASNDGDENPFDIALTGTGQDVAGPAGGTMTLNPPSPVDASSAITVSFAGWTDPSTPLSYAVLIDDVVVSPQGSSAVRNLTSPAAAGSHTLKGRVYDALNNMAEVTQSFTVNTPVESWRQLYFGATSNTGSAADTADFDGDSVQNVVELAFGTNPALNTSGAAALQYTGTFAGNGTVTAAGQPITMFESAGNGIDFRALFVRRLNFAAYGLTYTPQFSADLINWQDSAATPAVLADDGAVEVVSVPYPPFVGGKKARFFRISITITP